MSPWWQVVALARRLVHVWSNLTLAGEEGQAVVDEVQRVVRDSGLTAMVEAKGRWVEAGSCRMGG